MNKTQNILIKPYSEKRDAELLFNIMRQENDWQDYCVGKEAIKNYSIALKNCATYVLYNNDICCGFIRAKDDFGFGVYIQDLLVCKYNRGNSYGKMLIEQVCKDFTSTVYVLSDVDKYYKKQGYNKIEGRVIVVRE